MYKIRFGGKKMTDQDLLNEYKYYGNSFETIKNEIENNIFKTVYSRGVYYETFPFSYQRIGFHQGKLVEKINHIKSFKNIYIYVFNMDGKIIEIKAGTEIKDNFYYDFIVYGENNIKEINYNNGKTLQGIGIYVFDENKKVKTMYRKGRRGGREETYYYDKEFLKKIIIKQFDQNGNKGPTLQHLFEYNINGELEKIIKTDEENKFIDDIYK
jgi:hypothetical protein